VDSCMHGSKQERRGFAAEACEQAGWHTSNDNSCLEITVQAGDQG
jgi:hypothetical protein